MNKIVKKCGLIAILITQTLLIESMNDGGKMIPSIQFTSKEDEEKIVSTYAFGNLTIVRELKKRSDYETWETNYKESYSGFSDANYIGNEDAEKIFKHIESLGKMREELDSLVKQAELRRQEKSQRAQECSERMMLNSKY